jgi:hypothetical protein
MNIVIDNSINHGINNGINHGSDITHMYPPQIYIVLEFDSVLYFTKYFNTVK